MKDRGKRTEGKRGVKLRKGTQARCLDTPIVSDSSNYSKSEDRWFLKCPFCKSGLYHRSNRV